MSKFNQSILCLTLFIFFFDRTNAQQVPIVNDGKVAEERIYTVLDSSKITLQYKMLSVLDKNDPNKITENVMLLQIGKNVSKFMDFNRFLEDSLWNAYAKQKMNFSKALNKTLPLLRETLAIEIFKNYPANSITVNDRIPFDNYKYKESLMFPTWKLENEKKEVCGYNCLKATTAFRGRDYIAWYAPEIPISDGPWKFGGLPGLILRIEDSQREYSFECISLVKNRKPERIKYSSKKAYIETNREKFLETQRKYFSNPSAKLENSGKIKGALPASASKARPYNPIELSE